MAGLACGEANTVSWGILRDYAAAYISCPDYLAADGMRILGAPLPGDPQIVSGESGAITTGVLYWLMRHPAARGQRDALGLNEHSTVLLISTEGDTAPETYRKVVWFGAYPDEEMRCFDPQPVPSACCVRHRRRGTVRIAPFLKEEAPKKVPSASPLCQSVFSS